MVLLGCNQVRAEGLCLDLGLCDGLWAITILAECKPMGRQGLMPHTLLHVLKLLAQGFMQTLNPYAVIHARMFASHICPSNVHEYKLNIQVAQVQLPLHRIFLVFTKGTGVRVGHRISPYLQALIGRHPAPVDYKQPARGFPVL